MTENAKTKARHTPIKTMSLALSCSFVRRCLDLFIDRFSNNVLSADSLNLALRGITFRLFPVFEELTFISSPSLILTTSG
jgi:hypothetical protein